MLDFGLHSAGHDIAKHDPAGSRWEFEQKNPRSAEFDVTKDRISRQLANRFQYSCRAVKTNWQAGVLVYTDIARHLHGP